MKCPGCGQWVPERLESCPECKLDVSVLRSSEDLQTAVRRTRQEWDQSTARLAELEVRASALDSLIMAKLRGQPPIPPTPSPAVETKTEHPKPPSIREHVVAPLGAGRV